MIKPTKKNISKLIYYQLISTCSVIYCSLNEQHLCTTEGQVLISVESVELVFTIQRQNKNHVPCLTRYFLRILTFWFYIHAISNALWLISKKEKELAYWKLLDAIRKDGTFSEINSLWSSFFQLVNVTIWQHWVIHMRAKKKKKK